jgi:DNA-binding transcriptional MerR regulator
VPGKHHAPAGAGHSRDLAEAAGQVRPERHGIDRHRDVEGGVIERQLPSSPEAQVCGAITLGLAQSSSRLAKHDRGRIDAVQLGAREPLAEEAKQDARAEADLAKVTVVRQLNPVDQFPMLRVVSRHQPPRYPASGSTRHPEWSSVEPDMIPQQFHRQPLCTLNYGLSQGMTELSIGKLEAETGTPASTLRFYERKGLLPAPPRVGGQRRYPPAAIDRVLAIRLWQRAGFTIAEIGQLLADSQRRDVWQRTVRAKLADLQRHEEEIRRTRQQLEHALLCRASDWISCPWLVSLARSARSSQPPDRW